MLPVTRSAHPPNVDAQAMTPATFGKSGLASSAVVPGKAYAHGTREVGDSSENNDMPGSQGAGASATTQSGHATNR